MRQGTPLLTTAILLVLLSASAAAAQSPPEERRSIGFVEASGAYGFQLGTTDYLPDGAAQQYQHPLVNGYAVGASAGYFLTPALAVVVSYEYAAASSREGDVDSVLTRVQGELDYHTLVAGLRLLHPLGFGALRAEIGLGVVLPYETRLEVDYGPALAPAGIAGTGSVTEDHGLGVGGHAVLGYEMPIHGPLYVAANLKLQVFQSGNDGEQTRLRNYVTDLSASPPAAVDADADHGDGEAQPTTHSVQAARLQLALGVRF